MGTKGNFFAVDRRAWKKVCALGKMNLAVAYLVLARGTLRDLRTTAWSTNAIEDRTAIPRRAAKAAIESLIEAGFVERQKGGTKPLLSIKAVEAIRAPQPAKRPLKPAQVLLLEAARAHPEGLWPPTKKRPDTGWPEGVHWGNAQVLIDLGLVRRLRFNASAIVSIDPPDPEAGLHWIWLPNAIVDGAAGETPPIERLRQSQSVTALRLYVELYHAQSLSENGGVNWRMIRETYKRYDRGQYGEYGLYAFMPLNKEVFTDAPFFLEYPTNEYEAYEGTDGNTYSRNIGTKKFWEDLRLLTDTGLAEFVPHLVDADTDQGALIHPLARDEEGEEAEREIGAAAHAAAAQMLVAIGQTNTWKPTVRLVPAARHIQQLALVGLLRLRHRANTTATAAWYGGFPEWVEGAKRYRKLENAVVSRPLVLPSLVQHQREINGTSMGDQRLGWSP